MERQKQINRSRRTGNRQSDRRKRLTILFTHSIRDTNGKVLIAADEVDKWSRLCEGLQNEWECTTVNLDAFEKFHTIAVYDAVLIREKQKNRHFVTNLSTNFWLIMVIVKVTNGGIYHECRKRTFAIR